MPRSGKVRVRFVASNKQTKGKRSGMQVGNKFFKVPIEHTQEYNSAVYNRSSLVKPPKQSAFGGLDGAGDDEEEDTTPRFHSRGSSMRLGSVGDTSFTELRNRFESMTTQVPRSAVALPSQRIRRSSTFRSSLGHIDEVEGTTEDQTQHQEVEAVILQPIRPPPPTVAARSQKPFGRDWGKFLNPFEKLHHDEQIAREHTNPEATTIPQLLALTDASPPPEPPSPPRKSSPIKLRTYTSSPLRPHLSAAESADIDSRAIYLTPADQIPVYPPVGSVAYYEALAQRPQFVFDRLGYLKRSNVTNRMIALFENARTAPAWADTIPDLKAQRVEKKKRRASNADVDADEWVLYWETLVVKGDIRRGCRLAVQAAAELAREKGAEMEITLAGMKSRMQQREFSQGGKGFEEE